jgi:hypothetical protein
MEQRLAGRERVRGQPGGGERVADAVIITGGGVGRRRDADVVEGLLQRGRRRTASPVAACLTRLEMLRRPMTRMFRPICPAS